MVYHRLEVDRGIRRIRHAHLDNATAWPGSRIHRENNRALGMKRLLDGVHLVH